jgi:hypothetical protein
VRCSASCPETGCRLDARYEQTVPGLGARHIKEMEVGVIDLAQIGVVADCLDALLERNNLIVAGNVSVKPRPHSILGGGVSPKP